ncbi:uncharacterized protein FIBRA_05857 [Fibroporia radiculosa]|uniref:DUF202 domain-containing protein n=1 Tax=Fibroporia radiculosa TaxID=599839 RepID=J4IAY3_9APHY|nr:uncharacterized protein FIBRA_05857 [Fibroporia radiculosa]CCM03711.1 predicted protein [Fibroporia radiculosa]
MKNELTRLGRLIFRGYERVDNAGSTARDHLANERTYLAWARTSLGLIGLGIGVERFERFRADLKSQLAPASAESQRLHDQQVKHGRQLAGTLVGTGVTTMVLGTWRYYATLHDLQRGQFRPNVQGIALVAIGSAFVIAAVVQSELKGDKQNPEFARHPDLDGVRKTIDRRPELKVPVLAESQGN